MTNGEKIAQKAMKKELERLSRAVELAQADVKEYVNIVDEFISIVQEQLKIFDSSETSAAAIKKMAALDSRRERAKKVMGKDYMKLLEAETKAISDRDDFERQIAYFEFRNKSRS